MSFLTRRNFLTSTALAAVSGAALAEEVQPKQTVKFCLFSDIHHHPASFFSEAPKRLAKIQARALEENCDFIIHCGDFCHNPAKMGDFVAQFNDFQIPSHHVMGNHDFDGCGFEETFDAYKAPKGYYYFDCKGFRFVAIDANYFRNEDGTFTHYDHGNYFKYKGNAIANIPPEEFAWLKETLETSPFPCILFSHQSVEREVGGIANWEDVRKMLEAVNAAHPGRVRMYMNGHHHRDFMRLLNGIVYFDVNSASFDWVERFHDKYPKELCEKFPLAAHTVIFEDALYAIVTLDSDGLIQIDGTETKMLYGVTRQSAGLQFGDGSGRPVFPKVQSAKFRMIYS